MSSKQVSYNDEDQTLKLFLRGRPIILAAPSDIAENYDITNGGSEPSKTLELEWVYGYRGRDCRSNLYVLASGEIIYFVAAAVVLQDINGDSQRHYIEHTDDVKSLAIHPNKVLIASGQCAGHDRKTASPHIRIWDSESLDTKIVIEDDFINSISCLSFSKTDDGSLLVAVDESPDHVISIWNWQKKDKITETKCSTEAILAVEFHPQDEQSIVTCGKSHVGFWTFADSLSKKMGIFGNRDKPKFINCLGFLESGDVVTGDSNGNLAVWGRGTNTITNFLTNVHDGSIFNIYVSEDGNVITGGGKDGCLKYFDANLEKTDEEAQIDGQYGGIRMIAQNNDGQLLIGTTRNCVLQGNAENGFEPIVIGHSDELWALAINPTSNQFATAGQDKKLMIYDTNSKKMILQKDLEEAAQSIAFSPDGSWIAVGCLNGRWFVFNAESMDLIAEFTNGEEPIQVIQYSPDGNMIAIGSRDNHVYLYQISEGSEYSKLNRCSGHSSYITHIDWSSDSQYIRTNSGDYELLFWNAETGKHETHSHSLRDVEWATNNCTITFTTVGIWPEDADGTDVNACDRSHSSELLATADDFGKVNLYSYPVIQPEAPHHIYGGHSSHVTNVDFLQDDTKLISIGGKDSSILQWNVC